MNIAPFASLLSLRDQRALIAGGNGGIGQAIVELFVSAGAHVDSVDLQEPSVKVDGAHYLTTDVSQSMQVQQLFRELAQRAELPDILVHSVGITRDHVLWKISDSEWSEVLRVNLDSAFYLLREAIPAMRARGRGAVVLMSSINGERGKVGQANYAASKAGLIGMARSAAREVGRFGIRVNVIAPGMVLTPMTQLVGAERIEQARTETVLGRVAEPADVAHAALFLCSNLSRHVTGQVLRVDGGQLIA